MLCGFTDEISCMQLTKNIKTMNNIIFFLIQEVDELFQKKPWIKPEAVAGSNMPLGNLDTNKGSTNSLSEYTFYGSDE